MIKGGMFLYSAVRRLQGEAVRSLVGIRPILITRSYHPGDKRTSSFTKDLESKLDANELRPLIAENAEELLKKAAEDMPYAPGRRGSRRKKQQRERLRIVRRTDHMRKLEGINKHEKELQMRSGSGRRERLAKLGLEL